MPDEPPKVFKLIGVPEDFVERSFRTLVAPDDIAVGDILMADRSLEIRVEAVSTDWGVPRLHLDRVPPIPPGPFRVVAYNFPFVVAHVLAGPNKNQTMPIDVRMHNFLRVSEDFVAALLGKKGEPKE